MKEGEILRRTIALSDKKTKDIIDLSGIPKATLYYMYKQDEISTEDKIKLKKAGIVLDYSLKNLDEVPEKRDEKADLVTLLHEQSTDYRKLMADHIATLQRSNEVLERNNANYIAQNAELVKIASENAHTSKVMSKIVDLCLKSGALIVDGSKKVDLSKM